jgi:hypothetical protein
MRNRSTKIETPTKAITFSGLPSTPQKTNALTVIGMLLISALATTGYLAFGGDKNPTVPENPSTAATKATKDQETEPPNDSAQLEVLNSAVKPKLLTFGYVPNGYCLQSVLSPENAQRNALHSVSTQKYYRGTGAQRLMVSVGTQLDAGFGDTATAINVNGFRGQVHRQGTLLSLHFAQESASVFLISTGVTQPELEGIARSISLTWDENGPALGSIALPLGYEVFEPTNPNPYFAGAALTYVSCKNPTGSRRLTLTSNIYDNVDSEFWPNLRPTKKTGFKFFRGDIAIAGMQARHAEGYSSIAWQEGDTEFALESQLSKAEANKVLKQLNDAAEADFTALEDQVDDATHVFSDGQQFPTRGANAFETIGMLNDGSKIRLRAAIKDNTICLLVSSPWAGAIRQFGCRIASPTPTIDQSGQLEDGSVLSVEVVPSSVRAVMHFPSGKTKNIESFVDPRLPRLRVIIFHRGATDPLPERIQFVDETGKVIGQQ